MLELQYITDLSKKTLNIFQKIWHQICKKLKRVFYICTPKREGEVPEWPKGAVC